ncbi:hypothetical protein DW66_4533 [Pseudomonas putida]|nr:hypothetical protein DW66_4533 [Pseudomonas putida]
MTDGFSQRTPQQALAALLERFTPQRLLLVGTRFPALDAFAQAHPQVTIATAAPGPLPAELAAQRFDLAVLVDCLEHLPKRTGLELLGGIRTSMPAGSRCWPTWSPVAGKTPISLPLPCRPARNSAVTSRY